MKITNYNFKKVLNCHNYMPLEDLRIKKLSSLYFVNDLNQAKTLLKEIYDYEGNSKLIEQTIDKENYQFYKNKFINDVSNRYENISIDKIYNCNINRQEYECYVDAVYEDKENILLINLLSITKKSFYKKINIKNIIINEEKDTLILNKKQEINDYFKEILDIQFIQFVYQNSINYNPYKKLNYICAVIDDNNNKIQYIDVTNILSITNISNKITNYHYDCNKNCVNKNCKYYSICNKISNENIEEKEYIDKQKIKIELDKIKYPIYYLDFESYASIYPRFDDEKPFSQHVFLYCIIKQETEDSELQYYNYIAKDNINDYRKQLFHNLVNDLGIEGTIIVYNDTFEKKRIKEAKVLFNDIANQLESINDRIYDLLFLLRGHRNNKDKYYLNNNYYNTLQQGSYSIKTMIKVFGEEGYNNMEIKNGTEASISYSNFHLLDDEALQEEKNKLIKYCNKDVYSMAVILNKIKEKVK